MRPLALGFVTAILVIGLAVRLPKCARACAVAPPINKPVEIANESAIIVWDAKSGTEYFIRRATFTSAAQDFGFLVPTPTQPALAEADDRVFAELGRITAPRVVKQPRPSAPGCGISCSSVAPNSSIRVGSVQVLDESRVAGYDAAVLEASNAAGLTDWLHKHGYEFSDALKEWAEYYIRARWKITAFKVAKDSADKPVVSTSSVLMTFKTDKPFFPYREPSSTAAPGSLALPRLLRVFVISRERVDAELDGKPWPAKPVWSNALVAEDYEKVRRLLKLPDGSGSDLGRLTEFEDHSSPRPGFADVYFAPSADQKTIERPAHIEYTSSNLPGCIMCLATCGLVFFWHLTRRRNR